DAGGRGEHGRGDLWRRLRDRADALPQPDRPAEVAHLPTSLGGDLAQVAVGVHGNGVADRLQHRDVADRVGVGVRLREVDALLRRDLADGLGLPLPRAVELELARVLAVLDLRSGRDDPDL